MALQFHPGFGIILYCDFGHQKPPEMVKVRPVVIVSREHGQLCTVVPPSGTVPDPVKPWHYAMTRDKLPRFMQANNWWAKCDCLTTVALSRLERCRAGKVQGWKMPEHREAAVRYTDGVFGRLAGHSGGNPQSSGDEALDSEPVMADSSDVPREGLVRLRRTLSRRAGIRHSAMTSRLMPCPASRKAGRCRFRPAFVASVVQTLCSARSGQNLSYLRWVPFLRSLIVRRNCLSDDSFHRQTQNWDRFSRRKVSPSAIPRLR